MHLGVYSLEKVLYRGDAAEVNCPTESGEITILDHHEPLISILKQGTVKVVARGSEEKYFSIGGGFLGVRTGGEVRLLVDEGAAQT